MRRPRQDVASQLRKSKHFPKHVSAAPFSKKHLSTAIQPSDSHKKARRGVLMRAFLCLQTPDLEAVPN